MANKTIYPFGIDGELPSSIGIVNDLTTGGSDKALSAEMGKELAEMIDNLSDSVTASVQTINGKNVLVLSSVTTPTIISSAASLSFGDVEYGKSKSLTFTVSGRWFNGGITITSNSEKVVCSPSSTTGGETTTITATYTPTSDNETLGSTIVLSAIGCDDVTIAVSGAGVEEVVPTITLTPSTLSITTAQGDSATGVINVKGSNLEGDISLSISGTGFSLSANSVSKTEAESADGSNITVTFDGSATGSATITASTTNGNNVTASVSGAVVAPFANDTYFDSGIYRYYVRSGGKADVQYKGSGAGSSVNIVIPDTISDSGKTNSAGATGQGFAYKVSKINQQGFYSMRSNITSIDVGNNVTTIADAAFRDHTKLTTVTLGSSLETIGQNVFCTDATNQLVSVNFPQSLNTIGNAAFKYCPLTTSGVTIPSGMTSIGQYAFQYCQAREIHIYAGSSLTIGDYCFNNWYGKSNADCDIYCHADSLPTLGTSVFGTSAATLHVKQGVTVSGNWASSFTNVLYDVE